MLTQINTHKRKNVLFRDGFKNFENERIKPLFHIKYVLKPNPKKTRSSKERATIREDCRDILYNPTKHEESFVNDFNEDFDQKKPVNTPSPQDAVT